MGLIKGNTRRLDCDYGSCRTSFIGVVSRIITGLPLQVITWTHLRKMPGWIGENLQRCAMQGQHVQQKNPEP